jgi:hypothetical protein
MIFAKIFSAMFDGSMYGAGSDVFAVWTWLLTKCDYTGHIEVNARKLAGEIGASVEAIEKAIAFLEKPDPYSRGKEEDGRRIVREGEFLYRIVNYESYRDIRDAESKREYDRTYQRKRYAENKTSSRRIYEKTRDSSHIELDRERDKETSKELLASSADALSADEMAATLPLVDGSEHRVSKERVADWRAAFPAVDVEQQLAQMKVWLNANSKQRKTRKGIERFIVNWLVRQQNKGRGAATQVKHGNISDDLDALF